MIEKLTGGVIRCEELNDRVDWTYIRSAIPPELRDATEPKQMEAAA